MINICDVNFKSVQLRIFLQQNQLFNINTQYSMRAIFSIQGNIGSGKSTFLSLLKNYVPQIQVIPQPVSQWQKLQNRFNLLDQYYKDPKRWAFTFQINAVLSRAKELKRLFQIIQNEKDKSKIFFSERSIVADRQIFAKLLHQEGKMNEMQYALYINMYNSLQSLFKVPRIHKYIYLRTSPEKCKERMDKRARFQETGVELDYLKKIHSLHEQWLGKQPNTYIIQGEMEFQNNERRAKQMVKSVKKFLQL